MKRPIAAACLFVACALSCATVGPVVKDCSSEAAAGLLDDVNTALATGNYVGELATLVAKFGGCVIEKAVREVAEKAGVRGQFDPLEAQKAQRARAWLDSRGSAANDTEARMQIALVNQSKLSDIDAAFMAEACNAQVSECAAAWGVEPTPVAFYRTAAGLPAVECRIMTIVDDLDVPGALGYHDDDLGAIYGRVLNQGPVDTCVTLSHECLEQLIDPTCTGWRDMGGGRSVALEVGDPVQADTYAQPATIMDLPPRQMLLSNYVLPRWFDPMAPGNFDRLARLTAPLTMSPGGYLIVREKNGDVTNVFLRTAPGDTHARLNVATKVARPGSRTLRRLRG